MKSKYISCLKSLLINSSFTENRRAETSNYVLITKSLLSSLLFNLKKSHHHFCDFSIIITPTSYTILAKYLARSRNECKDQKIIL